MAHVKLKFTADLSKTKFFRVFLNSDTVPTKIEGIEIPEYWKAYEGVEYPFVFSKLPHIVTVTNADGKDITGKTKRTTDSWGDDSHQIPLSEKELNAMTKMKGSLFKKADPQEVKKILFCNLPVTFDKSAKAVMRFFEYCQKHLEDNNRNMVLPFLLSQNVDCDQKVELAIDCIEKIPGSYVDIVFDMNVEKNLNLEDLYFLTFNSDAEIFQSQAITIPNVIVYDGTLYFGNIQLTLPVRPSFNNKDIIIKKEVCEIGDVIKRLNLQ